MTNWDEIEKAWRFGKKSNVAIAKEHGISEGAIRKRAKAEGWVKGQEPGPRQPPAPKREKKSKAKAKAAKPEEVGEVPPMDMTIEIALRMLGELDAVTAHIGEIEDLIYTETENDRDARRRNAMLKAVSLNTRSMTLKTIQQTLAAAQLATKPEGKKAERKEAAKEVASGGKFAPPAPPKLVVNNKK